MRDVSRNRLLKNDLSERVDLLVGTAPLPFANSSFDDLTLALFPIETIATVLAECRRGNWRVGVADAPGRHAKGKRGGLRHTNRSRNQTLRGPASLVLLVATLQGNAVVRVMQTDRAT